MALPNAAFEPVISDITATSMFVTWDDDNEGPHTHWIGYGTAPAYPTTVIASDQSTELSGLLQGTTYYVWARAENAEGPGPWSPRVSATTLDVPAVIDPLSILTVTQTTVLVYFYPPFDSGSPITGYYLAYSTDPTPPVSGWISTFSITVPLTRLITGLNPGTKYYFWVRAVNAIGMGSWSAPINVTTVAGALVNVGGVWKRAVPYVRVGGVWRLAQPWVKVLGVWKETIN